jgi:hypothetical protein
MKRLRADQVIRQNPTPAKRIIHNIEGGNIKHVSFGPPKKYLSDDTKDLIDIYVNEENCTLTVRAIINEIHILIFDAIIDENKDYSIFENEIFKCTMAAILDIIYRIITTKDDPNHYHEKICHNIKALFSMVKTDPEKEQKLYAFIWYFFERFTKK